MAKEKKGQVGAKKNAFDEEGIIQVRVSDFANGLRIYDKVKLVRIKSKDYTLLIMEDYFPQLGAVNGLIELVTKEEQISLGRLKGFFMHRDNAFVLLIEEQLGEEGAEA